MTAKVFNIAKTAAHSSNFINSGVNKVTLFKAAAHGVARGAIQSAQGGSFKAGFMSGFSSGFDVGTSAMGGNTAGGFVARTVTMGIVGGTASALGGGKFSNGAMSGAFTHMFNAEGGASSIVDKVKQGWNTLKNYVTAGFGGGIHVGLVGINGQYDITSNALTVCARVGPGLYVGGGTQVGVTADKNINNNIPWSVGGGADIAVGMEGGGGQVTANTDGVNASGSVRIPYNSYGIGASAGIDCCLSFNLGGQ